MKEIDIHNIVKSASNEGIDSFMQQLQNMIDEDPKASATDFIARIIPHILEFSTNLTTKSLTEYHKELITFLNSSNHHE